MLQAWVAFAQQHPTGGSIRSYLPLTAYKGDKYMCDDHDDIPQSTSSASRDHTSNLEVEQLIEIKIHDKSGNSLEASEEYIGDPSRRVKHKHCSAE